jgi:hypothetical protein
MDIAMKVFEITYGMSKDYLCLHDVANARKLYSKESGVPLDELERGGPVNGPAIVRELSEDELKEFYILDGSETEPDELDPDDEGYDPTYDPDEWIFGCKIIETWAEWIKRQGTERIIILNI